MIKFKYRSLIDAFKCSFPTQSDTDFQNEKEITVQIQVKKLLFV